MTQSMRGSAARRRVGIGTTRAVPLGMSGKDMLESFVPHARLTQIDHVDVAVPARQAYDVARHLDMARAPLVRALFALRSIPARLRGHEDGPPRLAIDDITGDGSGFRLLAEDAGRGFVVGAIGRFWKPDIEWATVAPEAFAGFAEPGWGRVAWSIGVVPRGELAARVSVALRVDATDDASWRAVHRYFRLIGPFSHFIRREMLRRLEAELGSEREAEVRQWLPSDALIRDAAAEDTMGIDIAATPAEIWPWLVQMGCHRAGWYSYDRLDNGGLPSATEIVPSLQRIAVGDLLPATPDGDSAFEVLQIEPAQTLVLGGVYDVGSGKQVPFAAPKPERFWQATWAFVLQPLDAGTTRLTVRARVAFAPAAVGLRALWLVPIHHFMEAEQLRNLKRRAEGRIRHGGDNWQDVGSGIVGALGMLFDLATPFLRGVRNRWGLDAETSGYDYPGDEHIPAAKWQWTHGIEIDAPAADVWEWVAQIGVGRAGFYSYQWLENLVGCDVQNAERIHPEWRMRAGDSLRLHPKMPPMRVVELEEGRWLVALGGGAADEPDHIAATWLFYVTSLSPTRSRLISRFRVGYAAASKRGRRMFGPYLTEAIGFVMDRRMLIGVKERAERVSQQSRP